MVEKLQRSAESELNFELTHSISLAWLPKAIHGVVSEKNINSATNIDQTCSQSVVFQQGNDIKMQPVTSLHYFLCSKQKRPCQWIEHHSRSKSGEEYLA